MALEMHAFLKGQNLPTRDSWQAAIEALGYPVELGAGLDLSTSSGFLPCRIDDHESGFELNLDRAEELVGAYPQIKNRVGGSGWAVSFRWGGDLQECACVMAAAAGLVQCAEALVYYPADDLWYGAEELRNDFDSCRSQ